jgi:hypothetical protein
MPMHTCASMHAFPYRHVFGLRGQHSSKVNKYIMVLYEYHDNAILAEPIKTRTVAELLRAFQVMETKLTARGLQPKVTRLENEASQLFKSYLHDKNITFQLVTPYSHRINASEIAIRSFKDHLISDICSTDKAFPMHLLDRLLPQAVIQAIQGSRNECTIPSVISKFCTKHSPYLFSDWCCQVGILNISHFHIQIIQSSQGQCNPH